MKITRLYPDSNTKFSDAVIFGVPYLVNKNNPEERERYTTKLPGRYLYKQGENFLFLYEDKLFRIEEARACALHYSESTKDYVLLLTFGDDGYVYFYSVYFLEIVRNSWMTVKKEKPVIEELGRVKATNFEYFVHYFKESITNHYSDGRTEITMFDEDFAQESNPFFVLEAISRCLKENCEKFYLPVFTNAREVFTSGKQENVVTTFVRFTKHKMDSFDVVGNDFKLIDNYVWEEYDIIDDWEWYQDPDWTTCYKEWILNGTQLINIMKFQAYDVKKFIDKFKTPSVSVWKPNKDEIYVFISEVEEAEKYFKHGILWNLTQNTVFPNNEKMKENSVCEPVLFWHWQHCGMPNVTVEKFQDKTLFRIWYRDRKTDKFVSNDSALKPITYSDKRDNRIYYVKEEPGYFMLAVGRDFKLVSYRFLRELNLTKDHFQL